MAASRRMTSIERAVIAAFAVFLAAGSAEAHHTKPHEEAVAAARVALLERKDPQAVKRLLEGIWSGQPSDSETPYLLGLAYFMTYDADRSLPLFEACHAAEGSRVECLYWVGRAYALKAALVWYYRETVFDGVVKSQRAMMAALDRYEQVIALAPNHVGTILSQAEYYMVAPYLPPFAYGDKDKARALVERALAMEPSNPRANYLQARFDLYYNGRRDLARAGFAKVRQLLDREGGGAESILLRRWVDFAQAEVAFLDQDYPATVAYADAYLKAAPDGAEGYALKGASLKFPGREPAGHALLAKAKELNPHVRK